MVTASEKMATDYTGLKPAWCPGCGNFGILRALNKALVELYARLLARGKAHNAILIACARKLLVYANTVVQRGTPWIDSAVRGTPPMA